MRSETIFIEISRNHVFRRKVKLYFCFFVFNKKKAENNFTTKLEKLKSKKLNKINQ